MKQSKLAIIISTICIVAFFTTLIATILITKHAIATEKEKELYYAELYGLNQGQSDIVNEPVKFPSQEYIVDPQSATYKAIAELRGLHSQSDYYLMGGRVDKYTPDAIDLWDKILESSFLQATQYESIRDSFPEDDDIVKDMNNLIALVHIAVDQRNLDAMRYMHRILHDLDLYGFPAQGATAVDYFGATFAVPSSDETQRDEIITFINQKSNNEQA